MLPLLQDHIRARRVAAIVLPLGLLALAIGYLALFPQLETQLAAFADDIPEFYSALVGDAEFATPEGYVRSQVYALVAPLLACGVAIAVATRIARAERDVSLTVQYAAPVSRRSLALSYLGAAWTIGGIAAFAVFVGVLIGVPIAGADVRTFAVISATIPFLGLVWAAAGVAWAIACGTGSPTAASVGGWLFVGLSFLVNSVGEVVDSVSWLTDVSPWGWYGAGAAITDGFDPTSLLLFAVALVALVVGLASFERRDLQL